MYGSERKNTNVIIIEVDSLRPDHLGCYGYYLDTSPNIDKFSKKANLYVNCFSPANWTVPANYSLLTSLYLPQHRMDAWNSLIDKRIPNLINILYNNGYSIGVFGNQDDLLKSLKINFTSMLNESKFINAPLIVKPAVDWAGAQQKPFFLWLSFFEPHRPYNSPTQHVELFLRRRDIKLQMDKVGKFCWTGGRHFLKVQNKNGIDSISYYNVQYDASIHYIDSVIGKFLKELRRKGWFDNSLIIFISDHGESLGEHQLYFSHSRHLFNEIIKVPLIVKLPGQSLGRVINEEAGLIDVLPTILDEIGIKIDISLEGIPLRTLGYEKREFFSFRLANYYCLIYDNWKLIKYPAGGRIKNTYIKLFFPEYPAEKYQLINFKHNSAEKINFAKENKIVRDKMIVRMNERLLRMRLNKYKYSTFQLDQESKSHLKSLGYLN